MKSFFRFLSEARESQASIQAKKLGFVSGGHGDWYTRGGKLIARTDQGKLKFLDGRQPAAENEPQDKKTPATPPTANPQQKAAAAPPIKTPQTARVSTEPEENEEGGTLTVVFGRFNPPVDGHMKLFSTAKRLSAGGEIKVYPSRIQDPKKNPLRPEIKISIMKKMFPEYEEAIINDPYMKTIFDVLENASNDGFANVNIVVGSDRQAEIESLAQKYNGELYEFDLIRVVAAGAFDADASGLDGMSSAKMRQAVMRDDFESFRRGAKKTLNDGEIKAFFEAVRQGMGLKKSNAKDKNVDKKKLTKESYNLWEIAPEFDMKNLRDNYIKENIFKLGEKVQSLNTGLVGEVKRRGTNYLICVTEDGIMFKSWIKDLIEYTEVQMDSPMRDEKHPNTLVGTLGAFKYFASMTPGAIGTNKDKLQHGGKPYGTNLINKYMQKKSRAY